ncbi:hypothetical protein D3C76_192520 [compost metagenome]
MDIAFGVLAGQYRKSAIQTAADRGKEFACHEALEQLRSILYFSYISLLAHNQLQLISQQVRSLYSKYILQIVIKNTKGLV